jgi:hypothetical protein
VTPTPWPEAPLPLTMPAARRTAYNLRRKHHLSYHAIARIMGEYHGVYKGEGFWRAECYRLGAPRNPNKVRAMADRLAAA